MFNHNETYTVTVEKAVQGALTEKRCKALFKESKYQAWEMFRNIIPVDYRKSCKETCEFDNIRKVLITTIIYKPLLEEDSRYGKNE